MQATSRMVGLLNQLRHSGRSAPLFSPVEARFGLRDRIHLAPASLSRCRSVLARACIVLVLHRLVPRPGLCNQKGIEDPGLLHHRHQPTVASPRVLPTSPDIIARPLASKFAFALLPFAGAVFLTSDSEGSVHRIQRLASSHTLVPLNVSSHPASFHQSLDQQRHHLLQQKANMVKEIGQAEVSIPEGYVGE